MQRKSVLGLLGAMATMSFVWLGLTTAYAWTASGSGVQAKEAGTVLGASTEYANVMFKPYPVINAGAKPAFANSRRFIVYHPESGRVVAGLNENDSVAVASTTKLMTAMVVEKHARPNELVTVPQEAQVGGSTMGLRIGETLSVDALLKGLLLVSGNDAANTLAIHVGRILLNNQAATADDASGRFVDEMNATASVLGLSATAFKDPAGLNDEGRSSALDLAKIAAGLMNDQEVLTITQTGETTVSNAEGTISHTLKNSNRLTNEMLYPGVQIGKTGFTPDAGHCLVASSKQGDKTFIVVVLSTYSETKEASALEARHLLEWSFANVSLLTPVLPAQ